MWSHTMYYYVGTGMRRFSMSWRQKACSDGFASTGSHWSEPHNAQSLMRQLVITTYPSEPRIRRKVTLPHDLEGASDGLANRHIVLN